MLQGVGHQLVYDQAAGYRALDLEGDRLTFDAQDDTVTAARCLDMPDELIEIAVEGDEREVLGLVELLVDKRHGDDPFGGTMEERRVVAIAYAPRLQIQEARDDLEVVLHPMVDLPHQDRLFLQATAQVLLLCGDFALLRVDAAHKGIELVNEGDQLPGRLPREAGR